METPTYTFFSRGLTVAIGQRLSFLIASNVPDRFEGEVTLTPGGMFLAVCEDGRWFELQKILDPQLL